MNMPILVVAIVLLGMIIWLFYKTIKATIFYIVNGEEIKQSYFKDLVLLTLIVSWGVLFILILMFYWVTIL